jgi:hypothetical protein
VTGVGKPLSNGFTRVKETPEEVAEYQAKNRGRQPSVYRSRCDRCGKRIWHSGFGVGGHRRAGCERPTGGAA